MKSLLSTSEVEEIMMIDCNLEVSKKVKENFNNGEEYNKLNGSRLYLPASAIDKPDKKFIQWYNEKRLKR